MGLGGEGGGGEVWVGLRLGKKQTKNLKIQILSSKWNIHPQVSKHWHCLFPGSNTCYSLYRTDSGWLKASRPCLVTGEEGKNIFWGQIFFYFCGFRFHVFYFNVFWFLSFISFLSLWDFELLIIYFFDFLGFRDF